MSLHTISYSPINTGRWFVWTGFIALLILAPILFSSGGSLSLLSLMGTIMIFALSYNMLLGQSGMLSFGHAVYSGLGAFFAIHAINLSASDTFFIPLSLVPLVGGIAGLTFGILFGYVTTKRSGTTFSMISLGIVELVFACSLMFPGFFGGEGGVSGNRVFGKALMGVSFGPQLQVYYLIAAWLFISTVAMFAISHTPLGRIANAVRDNPERAEFIGYDTQRVRYLMLILSGFFAGIVYLYRWHRILLWPSAGRNHRCASNCNAVRSYQGVAALSWFIFHFDGDVCPWWFRQHHHDEFPLDGESTVYAFASFHAEGHIGWLAAIF